MNIIIVAMLFRCISEISGIVLIVYIHVTNILYLNEKVGIIRGFNEYSCLETKNLAWAHNLFDCIRNLEGWFFDARN